MLIISNVNNFQLNLIEFNRRLTALSILLLVVLFLNMCFLFYMKVYHRYYCYYFNSNSSSDDNPRNSKFFTKISK